MVDVMQLTGQSNGWRGVKEQETERRIFMLKKRQKTVSFIEDEDKQWSAEEKE